MGRNRIPESSGYCIESLAEALVKASQRNPTHTFAVTAIGPKGRRHIPCYSVKVLEDLFKRGLTAPLIEFRIRFMEHDFPSSPARPPKHVVYFRKPGRLATHGFCTPSATRCFVELVLGPTPHKWVDDNTIETEDGLQIQSATLSDVMESTGNVEMPRPYPEMAAMIAGRAYDRHSTPTEPETTAGRRTRKSRSPTSSDPSSRPQRTPKTSGQKGIPELSSSLNLAPTAIRKTLRKHQTPKPYAWSDEQFDKILALFTQN